MHSPFSDIQKQTLTQLRIIWAAMLASQVILLAVFMLVLKPGSAGVIDPQVINMLHIASLGFMILAVPAGHVLRSQQYKRNWQGHAVTPAGYVKGNILMLAMCEAVSMFALVVTYLGGALLPFIIPSAVAAATHVMNWPNGKPMLPREPDLFSR